MGSCYDKVIDEPSNEDSYKLISENSIQCELTENMLFYSGKYMLHIALYDSMEDKLLKSFPFCLQVYKSHFDEKKIIQSNEFSQLTKAMNDIYSLIGEDMINYCKIGEQFGLISGSIFKTRDIKGIRSNCLFKTKTELAKNEPITLLTLPNKTTTSPIIFQTIIGDLEKNEGDIRVKIICKDDKVVIIPYEITSINKYLNLLI